MMRRPILETSAKYFKHQTHISNCDCRGSTMGIMYRCIKDQLYFVSVPSVANTQHIQRRGGIQLCMKLPPIKSSGFGFCFKYLPLTICHHSRCIIMYCMYDSHLPVAIEIVYTAQTAVYDAYWRYILKQPIDGQKKKIYLLVPYKGGYISYDSQK